MRAGPGQIGVMNACGGPGLTSKAVVGVISSVPMHARRECICKHIRGLSDPGPHCVHLAGLCLPDFRM